MMMRNEVNCVDVVVVLIAIKCTDTPTPPSTWATPIIARLFALFAIGKSPVKSYHPTIYSDKNNSLIFSYYCEVKQQNKTN